MGQQQLLLLVLGIVIVGLAVVVGIQAFTENQAKANADALVNDGVRIASDVQAWKLKPAAFGGGSSATGYTGLDFEGIGYPVNADGDYENLNGTWAVTTADGTSFVITGTSDFAQVEVTVDGTTPDDIATVITTNL